MGNLISYLSQEDLIHIHILGVEPSSLTLINSMILIDMSLSISSCILINISCILIYIVQGHNIHL